MSPRGIAGADRARSNPAERLAPHRGARRALPLVMHDIDAIEAINVEQLVTVTDRLLLRGRVTKRRLSTNKIVSCHVARRTIAFEPTELVRRPRTIRTSHLAILTSLTAVAASLACML